MVGGWYGWMIWFWTWLWNSEMFIFTVFFESTMWGIYTSILMKIKEKNLNAFKNNRFFLSENNICVFCGRVHHIKMEQIKVVVKLYDISVYFIHFTGNIEMICSHFLKFKPAANLTLLSLYLLKHLNTGRRVHEKWE